MRKIENGRTLCDYYNEIVYKVNQLTEMCGNTDEAIKLRDDIYDMFTVKFSEPLDDISGLQEQLGCPLDAFIKALKNGIWCELERNKSKEMYYCPVLANGEYFLISFNQENDTIRYFNDYKKTWWLKEDRSE